MVARSWRVPPRGTRRFFEGGFAGFLSEAPPAPPTRRAPPFLPEEMGGKKGRGAFRLFKKEASHGFSSKAPPAPSTPAPQYGVCWRRWAVQTGQRPAAHRRPLRRHKLRIARFAVNGKARSLHCASSPHRTRFAGLRRGPRYWSRYRRCCALGGTHRGYPASPESGCAVTGLARRAAIGAMPRKGPGACGGIPAKKGIRLMRARVPR